MGKEYKFLQPRLPSNHHRGGKDVHHIMCTHAALNMASQHAIGMFQNPFPFWANEAIFQLMMLVYNLFLLFKMDFAKETEYRQQIKTFRLKYIFLAGKIIRTARSVVMKLSEKYPYREIYEKCLS